MVNKLTSDILEIAMAVASSVITTWGIYLLFLTDPLRERVSGFLILLFGLTWLGVSLTMMYENSIYGPSE